MQTVGGRIATGDGTVVAVRPVAAVSPFVRLKLRMLRQRAARADLAGPAVHRRHPARCLPGRHGVPPVRGQRRRGRAGTPDGGELRRCRAGARLGAAAAGLVRGGRDTGPGPVRAAAAAATRLVPACSPPPWWACRPWRATRHRRAAGAGRRGGRPGRGRSPGGRPARRAGALRGRRPRRGQRLRHHAAVAAGPGPGRHPAGRTRRAAGADPARGGRGGPGPPTGTSSRGSPGWWAGPRSPRRTRSVSRWPRAGHWRRWRSCWW